MKDQADAASRAPFRIVRPARPSPLIYAAPHAGRLLPDDWAETLAVPVDQARSLEDPLTDALIAGAADLGATILTCAVARAYVDVNRAEDEIDPRLLAPGEKGGRETARTRAGLGVVPRLTAEGRALHRAPVGLAEIQARIEAVHRPYHAALAGLMQETKGTFGVARLVDWHSMPSAAVRGLGRDRPQIVLGDRHGESCDGPWAGRVRAGFEAGGRRVAMNRPYAGGHVTQAWGRPSEGYHALQVEIDRSVYVDEASYRPTPGFETLKAEIEALTRSLVQAEGA